MRWWPILLCVLFAGTASAQTTPIFRMDCGTGGSAYPLCGFGYVYTDDLGVLYTRTRVAGGSPSGRDSVRLTAIPGTTNAQFEWGWIYFPPTAVPQGARRYLRWRFKIISPVRWRAVNGNPAGGKLVILGNLCEQSPWSPTRVISNLDATNAFQTPFIRTEQNIAGPPSRLDITAGMAPDVWHSVQLEVRSSSTASSADGLLQQYVDAANASESTPSGQSSGGFVLRTSGWSVSGCPDTGIAFGNTFNSLATGEHFEIEVADFEYDDAFDPGWHLTATPAAAPPRNVRIR